MEQQNYNCSITANINAEEAFKKITRVSEWWSEDIKGSCEKTNDVFTIRFVFGDSFTVQVIDIILSKKIMWLVTDCNLTWVKDNKEWKGTKISFEISAVDNTALINFTHIGLVPGIECYKGCSKGWDYFIKESLFKLLNEGKGLPDRKK